MLSKGYKCLAELGSSARTVSDVVNSTSSEIYNKVWYHNIKLYKTAAEVWIHCTNMQDKRWKIYSSVYLLRLYACKYI